jgi:hypothetical protein
MDLTAAKGGTLFDNSQFIIHNSQLLYRALRDGFNRRQRRLLNFEL